MGKNVLITGGAGFIGKELLKKLENRYTVTVIDNFLEKIHGSYSSVNFKEDFPNVNLIVEDISRINNWTNYLENIDIVIHFAAETGTGESMYRLEQYFDTNVMATARLAEAVALSGVKKIIVSSSRSLYGEGAYYSNVEKRRTAIYKDDRDLSKGQFEFSDLMPIHTREEDPVIPKSIYALTKYTQEQIFISGLQGTDIKVISLRFQNVYGQGQSLSNPYTGILSIFSNRMLRNKEIEIFEDGNESRDFIHVKDVSEAVNRSVIDDNLPGGIYNIGSGRATTVLEVFRLLAEKYDYTKAPHISGRFRSGDIRHNFADITKFSTLADWSPTVSFKDGIAQFCDWVKSQELPQDKYEQSLNELKEKGMIK